MLIDLMKSEIWKDIKGYEGYYQVSNYGRVRSLDRTVVDSWCTRNLKGKILKQTKHNGKQKYYYVSLSKDNQIKKVFVHRLVARAFISNMKIKPQVNHKDGNPFNNKVENLEWVTNAENTQHAYDTKLNKKNQLPISFNGQTKSLRKWCRELNLNYKSTWYRLNNGWSIEKIFCNTNKEVMPKCHK